MKVYVKAHIPGTPYMRGDVVEVDDETARAWIARGLAEEVKAEKPKANRKSTKVKE